MDDAGVLSFPSDDGCLADVEVAEEADAVPFFDGSVSDDGGGDAAALGIVEVDCFLAAFSFRGSAEC